MAFEIRILPGSAAPIFRQIVDQVRLAATTGQLRSGEQLPSVRALAERLLINPNTVARAYSELASDGVIESQPGRGAFVSASRQIYTRPERLRRIEPLVNALITEGLSLGFAVEELTDAIRARAAQVRGKQS
ncbi:MAG: GntR family transcriptional regulator [Burkholderiales bacterium]|nr:GntR family transcriptional regulator [Phycisphaerae bacterium]